MNPYTGFRDQAYAESTRILGNVRQNIENSISARGLTEKHFYAWMKEQGVKEVHMDRLKKYPTKGHTSSDHLSVLCLCATYMGLSVEEALFKVLTPEQHRLRNRR